MGKGTDVALLSHMCVFLFTCMCTVCAYIWVCACAYACVYIHVYVCVYVRMSMAHVCVCVVSNLTSYRNSEPSLSLHYFELVLLNSNLHLVSLVLNFNPELSIFGFVVGLFIHFHCISSLFVGAFVV